MTAAIGRLGKYAGIAVALLLAACAQKALPPYTVGDAASQALPAYQLGSGDKLQVTTFGEPALTGPFDVSPAGDVDLPLIGAIKAAGKSPLELGQAISASLAAGGYLKDPRVSVDVLNYRPFYILGEVIKPGAYPYSNGMTVLNAVATAEGFTYRANSKRIFVRHMGEAGEHEILLTAATPVLPGDTVRIGERYF